ncbi:hypothetical protein EPUS_09117 [Endocarpon pusillum Z07020]|uniref:F-box domain-containing protein n=1 Tax=Endocarpon pusillum (strain Z07020 / HMAS-L-300199) TaxID=1263415 RepID=U1GH83_ENDPU|nr:uncharacterized protein EPUS_09117 [Endocarpon pusillum Z07020]ERF71131.1 hypothetical protein EPUS_09117 [Endocarpon pusillum Z07020]
MNPPLCFLHLPTEVRLLVYRHLFSELSVTVASATLSPEQAPWAIFRTCRTCYDESLPIFYELATISLKHEAYLHVLRRKIGPDNMARLQSVALGGFRNMVHKTVVEDLPATLRKLFLGWKGNTAFSNTTPKSHLDDDQMRDFLEWSFRHYLDPSVGDLLAKAPNLRIFLDTIIGNAPPNMDPASAGTSRYAVVRVEIVRGQDGEKWSWGHVDRKIDRLKVVEP